MEPDETTRIDRLESKLASLEIATAHGFGEVRQGLSHLSDLVRSTIDKPAPPPVWVLLLSSGTFLVGLGSLVVAVAQIVG